MPTASPPLAPPLFFSPIIVYLILALMETELYPEVLLRNFRKKDLMRHLGAWGGGTENYLERNEGKN